MLTRNQLAKTRALLVKELARVAAPDEEREEILIEPLFDVGDMASAEIEREMAGQQLDIRTHHANELRWAIERIDRGEYGKCTDCGADIDVHRLEALPYARLCHHCQERVELLTEHPELATGAA
jgi:DnaK suppressor protein